MGSGRRSPWLDTSQVFADTRRIDLFNDPAWGTASAGPGRGTAAPERAGRSWLGTWRTARSALSLHKRGAHSRKPA
ncbi:MAG TPA: hypothetical protein VMB72_14425 [Acidimicrobiales bacterium]|nr:hypothetical protein [Acidimicrobiales bacterium]